MTSNTTVQGEDVRAASRASAVAVVDRPVTVRWYTRPQPTAHTSSDVAGVARGGAQGEVPCKPAMATPRKLQDVGVPGMVYALHTPAGKERDGEG